MLNQEPITYVLNMMQTEYKQNDLADGLRL